MTKQVVLAVEPIDAEVFDGDRSLGKSPVVLEVPEGEVVKLKIMREGYAEKLLDVDGSKDKLLIRMEPEKKAAVPARPIPKYRPPPVRPRPRPKPKPKSKLGGGEIVNPWD